jgi:Skp family chaperone for outer membrane proteins
VLKVEFSPIRRYRLYCLVLLAIAGILLWEHSRLLWANRETATALASSLRAGENLRQADAQLKREATRLMNEDARLQSEVQLLQDADAKLEAADERLKQESAKLWAACLGAGRPVR